MEGKTVRQRSESGKAVKTLSFMVVATLLSKVLGLARDLIFANYFGTGAEANAYLNAARIPVLFFDLTLGAAIVSTFVPVFNRYMIKEDKERALRFSHSFITLVALIATAFCLIGLMFPGALVNIIGAGFSQQTKDLSAQLLMIMMPTTIFTAVAYCLVGILQSLGEFNIPSIISVVSNGTVIIYLLCFNKQFGVYGMAVAMLVGWGLQVAVQVPSLIKKGYRYRLRLDLKDQGVRDVVRLAPPILISSWTQPLCFTINAFFASFLNGGQAYAAVEYANRIYIIIVGVFAFAITNYIFPALSRMDGSGDKDGFTSVMGRSISLIVLIIAPIMAGMIVLARPIINVLYLRGEFTEASAVLTSTALAFYSIGMVSYGINEILNKCFYAKQDVKTPMFSALIGIGVTGAFSFLFTRVFNFGIGGLALGGALSAIAISIYLSFKTQKNIGRFINRDMIGMFAKVVVAVLVMSVAVVAVRNLTAPYGDLAQLVLATVAGALVYFAMLFILKVNQVKEVLKW